MYNILITGVTGTLGNAVIKKLDGTEHAIKAITTKENPELYDGVEIVKADLTRIETLQAVVNDADVIIHSASNPLNTKIVDFEGTRNLLAAIDKTRIKHFIYISIAGVDKSQFPYYMVKHEVEQLVKAAGIPFTILRATQFHDFVLNRMIKPFDSGADLNIPAQLKFQSIDVTEVAGKIKELVVAGPVNGVITIGGPEVLTIEKMAETYLSVLRKTYPVKAEMMAGERFDLFRSGINLCKEHTFGKITWQQYLTTLAADDKL